MPPIEDAKLHKEIDLIQSCITRMAHNSFLIKGWAISLVAIVLALVGKGEATWLVGLVVLVPLVSFWYLDGFFLQAERRYRKLYIWVLKERLEGRSDKLYDLNPNRFKKDVPSVWGVMHSKTLWPFYTIPITIVLLFTMISFCGNKNVSGVSTSPQEVNVKVVCAQTESSESTVYTDSEVSDSKTQPLRNSNALTPEETNVLIETQAGAPFFEEE